MKLAFDAKRAFLNNSGLGNYARTLLKSLNKCYPSEHYDLFTTRQANTPFAAFAAAQKNFSVHEPESFIDRKLRSRWRSYGITPLLTEIHADVYHGLSNELPFNIQDFKGRKVVTIHDLIFLTHPHLYPYLDRKIYNKKFRHACDAADIVIAISEETKKDLERFYFIPENKIRVVYQSCDELYYREITAAEKERVREKYGLPEKFLLYVGTIEERKNLLTVVKALKKVKDIPLVAIGRRKTYFEKVKEFIKTNSLQKRVFFPDEVAHEDMPAIYRMAEIFIFPSFFEGFGIPIIEALTSGTPVITTRGGCFPEAGGPDSIYINPESSDEIAENINLLLGSADRMSSIAEKGLAYSARFHPTAITQQLMNIYRH